MHVAEPTTAPPTWLIVLLGAACGLAAANLYYAQPLLGPIADSLGMSRAAAGLIVTLTQCGYGLGLLFIVPLSDLMENRRLIVLALCGATLALIAAALLRQPGLFLIACIGIGLGSVAAQVIVPYASHLTPEASRGRVVGNVMSGLLLGIMFARPLSSMVADVGGWHAMFALSAAMSFALAMLLWRVLPKRQPAAGPSYGALLHSMLGLVRDMPVLRRRGLYHACAFAAFSLYWTAVPLYLASPAFGLSQMQIALFALAGVAGAIAAPITGRLADRGWSKPGTPVAMLLIIGGFALSLTSSGGHREGLALLLAAAVIVDMGVSASLLLGQRAVFALGAHVRGRLNGLFMAMFFAGGAIGSTLGAWAYATGGWTLAASIGMALPAASLLYLLTDRAAVPLTASP